MKVCHFTSVHSASDGRIFLKECVSLSKAGYDVYLIAPNAIEEVKKEVHIIGVNFEKEGRLNRMLLLTKKIYEKALSIDADIYHFHDPELLYYALKLKKKGKKVIFDSHEDVVNQILQKKYLSFFRYIISFLYAKYEKYVLSRLDAVISVTPHIVDRLKRINSNTVQITNYPLLEELGTNTLSCMSNKIVFAGGVSPLWLHENIIESLKSVDKDVTYTLAGSTSEEYMKKLESLDEWNRVEYLGVISRQDVLSLYHNSFMGIALMDYVANVGYNMGTLGNNKLFEFMSAGLPVLCTDFILWKEIIDKWKCGVYVNSHDIQAIGNAINDFYNNRELAQKMGNNGLEAVKSEYNWNTQEIILLDLYKKIM